MVDVTPITFSAGSTMINQQVPVDTWQRISYRKARGSVTSVGWRLVQDGHQAYSRDMEWKVYRLGGLYFRRRLNQRSWAYRHWSMGFTAAASCLPNPVAQSG
jgi:hypothetical protein